MRKARPFRRRGAGQRGVALVLALCLLIAILLMGASAAQLALQGEKSARGERDWHIAFQAAEEALMDAEHDIEGAPGAPGRGALFAPDSALGFADGCGAGLGNASLGLCLRAAEGRTPVWQSVDFSDGAPASAKSVPYGQFTGATMRTGEGFLPFKRPRYIIELLPYTREGEDATTAARYFYRITAIGFGPREGSQVVLQSFYCKPDVSGSMP
ncbi:MAG TPA: pilus assembly protein PilX [Janthinobacterium sp.]|nr:pilus assembly protein PilX [Janthinobacterium sp.]